MSEESKVYTFGEYVRKLRQDRNLTLKAAASKVGMPSQKLCDIESGRRYHSRISVDLVKMFSKAYDVPINEIFSSIQSTLHVAQTTEDVLTELVPITRLSEMVAFKLKSELSTYPKELEELASELHGNLQKIMILTRLIQSRNVPLNKKVLED